MKQCVFCGHDVDDSASRCPACGSVGFNAIKHLSAALKTIGKSPKKKKIPPKPKAHPKVLARTPVIETWKVYFLAAAILVSSTALTWNLLPENLLHFGHKYRFHVYINCILFSISHGILSSFKAKSPKGEYFIKGTRLFFQVMCLGVITLIISLIFAWIRYYPYLWGWSFTHKFEIFMLIIALLGGFGGGGQVQFFL